MRLIASETGLAKIRQAREESGRAIDDEYWSLAASRIVEPEKDWQPGVTWFAPGCSPTTWQRFLRGKDLINAPAFKAFCQVLGLFWRDVADLRDNESVSQRSIDWDAAPDTSVFYGRTQQLSTLEQWILSDRCRVVAILGMGGVGKTSLAVRLGRQIEEHFEFVVWRSLNAAPRLDRLLDDLLGFLDRKFSLDEEQTTSDRVSKLLEILRSRRCLICLDGLEALLQPHEFAGKYRQEYKNYSRFFRQIGEANHRSCFFLTSTEPSVELVMLDSPTSPVRSLRLEGLSLAGSQRILEEYDLQDKKEWPKLISRYEGNPFALKLVAPAIEKWFAGSVAELLKQNTFFVGRIKDILDVHFDRLSELEIQILQYLANTGDRVSLETLHQKLASGVRKSHLMMGLESLEWRSLVVSTNHQSAPQFSLQPTVRKYVRDRWGEKMEVAV